jgi:AraC-like DNA-binding protein
MGLTSKVPPRSAELGGKLPAGALPRQTLTTPMLLQSRDRFAKLDFLARGWRRCERPRHQGGAARAARRAGAPWTLEELARTAGTSRSVLAERLAQPVGQAPMQCMLFASNLLARSIAPLVRIAEEVGYLRTLLIHGARSAIVAAQRKSVNTNVWLAKLLDGRHPNIAAVALANKNARTVWALLAHGREFRADYVPTASTA